MRSILNKLKRNRIWSVGLYVTDNDFGFGKKVANAGFVLNSKKLRSRSGHVHTYADPFLFVDGETLYIFYEKQTVGEHGVIEAVRTTDLKNFQCVGEVLREPFHVSYPNVFRSGDGIYMVPESCATDEISLYKFADFPQNPVKLRILVRDSYQDPSLKFHNGVWYLFATCGDRLDLFFSSDLESSEFAPHPCSPLSDDLKLSQCGGGIVDLNGSLYRIAQDRSGEYGRNIHILRVVELSTTNYREKLFAENYLEGDQSWNARGGHHLSVVEFLGKTVIATDGKQDDLRINKFLALASRATAKAGEYINIGRDVFRTGSIPAKAKRRPKLTSEIM